MTDLEALALLHQAISKTEVWPGQFLHLVPQDPPHPLLWGVDTACL